MTTSFGIEEEMMILDATTLRPRSVAPVAIRELTAAGVTVCAELLPSQLEHATAVHVDGDAALDDLRAFRRAVADWCRRHDLLPFFGGTPPFLPLTLPRIIGDRYRRISRDIGALAQQHHVNGLHVHVGVADDAERVRVTNGLREWLPLLVAVSADSPFWNGQDTGFLSWRAVQTRRWTTNGVPPLFADVADHDSLRERLVDVGATREAAGVSWGVRLSTRFPTVEVRVCDGQLNAEEAVGIAELIVAIADRAREVDGPRTRHHILDAELWHAARFGLAHGCHDPVGGRHRAGADVIDDVRAVLPLTSRSAAALQVALAGGQGAHRQRLSTTRGGLRRLLTGEA